MAPFRSRNTGFNASSFSSLPLSSSWDRSDSDSDSKKRASKHSRSNPQFRGFDDLRRRWPSRGFRRKGLSAMSEGGGFQKRETRRLFRTEIGTTRSLRRSRTLECRYDEERTRHSSRIRPREEAKNRTEE